MPNWKCVNFCCFYRIYSAQIRPLTRFHMKISITIFEIGSNHSFDAQIPRFIRIQFGNKQVTQFQFFRISNLFSCFFFFAFVLNSDDSVKSSRENDTWIGRLSVASDKRSNSIIQDFFFFLCITKESQCTTTTTPIDWEQNIQYTMCASHRPLNNIWPSGHRCMRITHFIRMCKMRSCE